MAGRLDGKVAMITGAASGIGLGTLELFVSEGARVIAADVQDEKGAMLERRFPDAVRYVRCDVTAEADIVAAVALAESAFGGLDIQFNNAGISDRMGTITEVTADGWNWIFDILVRGPALGMKHAVPAMLKRGGGSIINTASIAGLQAGWGPIAYSTAKAGVVHMSRCAAAQLSPQGIRVNAICPGLIETGMTKPIFDGARARGNEAKIGQLNPLTRYGVPSEIAHAGLFLASDDASYVNGQAIAVDGGLSSSHPVVRRR